MVLYLTFFGPKIMSLISIARAPTLATIDWLGVSTPSIALAIILSCGSLTKLKELNQKTKMTAVTPNDMTSE